MFPNGMNESDYEGYKDWTLNQWAWEFLRRNKKYRAQFKDANGDADKLADAATRWGLKEMKAPDEAFLYGKEPFFKARIRKYIYPTDVLEGGKAGKDKAVLRIGLRKNEMAISFDLQQDVVAQLAIAKAMLVTSKKRWQEEGIRVKSNAVKNVKKDRAGYITPLRAYDANRAKESLDELGRLLAPHLFDAHVDKTKQGNATGERKSHRKMVTDALKRARDLVKGGYLTLALHHRKKNRLGKVRSAKTVSQVKKNADKENA